MWISWTLGWQSIAQTSTKQQVFRMIQTYLPGKVPVLQRTNSNLDVAYVLLQSV